MVCGVILGAIGGCSESGSVDNGDTDVQNEDTMTVADVGSAPNDRCFHYNPYKNVYFGDLHVHTSLSLDANLQGTRLRPFEAYTFARGETVGMPPYDSLGRPLRTLTIDRPLDFAAVTDHAEFLGAVTVCTTPGVPGYDHPQCVQYREQPDLAFILLNTHLAAPQGQEAAPALCGEGGKNCQEPLMAAWSEIQDAAEAALDPSRACTFSTLVGYEWSGNPGTANLHRNVLFRTATVPAEPVGYFSEAYPEGLWAALREKCIDQLPGCDVITISHNSNLSNGRMFEGTNKTGAPIDAAYAAEQAAMEPLVEIMQHKGDSECMPGSPLGDDECDFEKMPYDTLAIAFADGNSPPEPKDFVRDALVSGLTYWEQWGINPYAFGIIASTDTHLGTAGAVDERTYPGHGGAGAAHTTELPRGLVDTPAFNPGGLVGVWAEENRRESIFDALKRKETFGTSGPRIVVRFFGGFDYPSSACEWDDFAAQSYTMGVPMGGNLEVPKGGGAPRFGVWAAQDPGTEAEKGVPIHQVQIIKCTAAKGKSGCTVFSLYKSTTEPSLSTADCVPDRESGETSVCQTWEDPDFDPEGAALYYVRVLQNPTCRWTTLFCQTNGVDCAKPATIAPGYEGCCDDRFAKVVSERAWTSPIWVLPKKNK